MFFLGRTALPILFTRIAGGICGIRPHKWWVVSNGLKNRYFQRWVVKKRHCDPCAKPGMEAFQSTPSFQVPEKWEGGMNEVRRRDLCRFCL